MNYFDRVDMIKTNAVKLKRVGYLLPVEQLEPIPLTPDILEKNKFTKNRGPTSWKFETKREDLIDIYGIREYHLSINIEDTHCSGKGYRWLLYDFVIRYVHELQHILRDCRIEKEIII